MRAAISGYTAKFSKFQMTQQHVNPVIPTIQKGK